MKYHNTFCYASRIQRSWKLSQIRKTAKRALKSAQNIQCVWRKFLLIHHHKREINAATTIQKSVRYFFTFQPQDAATLILQETDCDIDAKLDSSQLSFRHFNCNFDNKIPASLFHNTHLCTINNTLIYLIKKSLLDTHSNDPISYKVKKTLFSQTDLINYMIFQKLHASNSDPYLEHSLYRIKCDDAFSTSVFFSPQYISIWPRNSAKDICSILNHKKHQHFVKKSSIFLQSPTQFILKIPQTSWSKQHFDRVQWRRSSDQGYCCRCYSCTSSLCS